MIMTAYRFLEPVDVLFLRGNRLFGDPGSHGESLMMPWPSVAAGALRTMTLVHDKIDPEAFARGKASHATIGTPDAPGPFAVTAFQLARKDTANGKVRIEALRPRPADLILAREVEGEKAPVTGRFLHPVKLPDEVASSAPLLLAPVLTDTKRRKADANHWLTDRAWADYLAGRVPKSETLVEPGALWSTDSRVGVGLSTETRRADDGKLFTTQAVVLGERIGFLVGVDGATIPEKGFARFGGDGRAVAVLAFDYKPPSVDLPTLVKERRLRLVLTTPGLFPEGWRLPGMAADGAWSLGGVRGRVVSAVVPRAGTVSGWDLARWRPKSSMRSAPAGSVYWIEDLDATPEALAALRDAGLWPDPAAAGIRRTEGFNRFEFAVYPKED